MSFIEHQIEADVPVRVAYDQWTQFESFPLFMEGVKQIRQIDDRTLEWRAEIAGQERKWTAVITDQTPDVRVAWKSVDGADNAGAVLFAPLGPDRTRLTLRLDAHPDGVVESVGDALGFLERRARGDLERFKEYIEARRAPTGAWRGEIHGTAVEGEQAMDGSAEESPALSRQS